MPRRQPPKEYYTATEVKKILNISDAMIRHHVQKRRIHYFLPQGRKQGFYLKKDVDKLANELEVFFNLDEDAPSKFMKATKEDLPEVMEIARTLFGGGSNENRMTPLERRIAWMEKNDSIFHILKRDEETIGYTSVLPFKQHTDKIEKLLRADFAGEVDITPDDIEEYEQGKYIQFYITSIGIKPSIHYPKRRIYAARLISNLIENIIELGKQSVIIENIMTIGATPDGIRLLRQFGFTEISSPVPGRRVFTINIEESGIPLILRYKQALRESKE